LRICFLYELFKKPNFSDWEGFPENSVKVQGKPPQSKTRLLRRFAPRNDKKGLIANHSPPPIFVIPLNTG
ncbi:MAG: hypothetical protein ACPL7E_01735, partial [bacterium]